MVNRIYPSEPQLYKANVSDTEASFLDLHLSISNLIEEKEILSRWTKYCSELYNYESCGDNAALDCSQPPEFLILCEEVEVAVASLKKGRSAELIIYQQNLFKLPGRP